MMSDLSPAYTAYANDKSLPFTLNLLTCLGATPDTDGMSIAKAISLEHPNATITAFDGFAFYQKNYLGTPNTFSISSLANVQFDKKNNIINNGNGFVVTFQNGQEISRIHTSEYFKRLWKKL